MLRCGAQHSSGSSIVKATAFSPETFTCNFSKLSTPLGRSQYKAPYLRAFGAVLLCICADSLAEIVHFSSQASLYHACPDAC